MATTGKYDSGLKSLSHELQNATDKQINMLLNSEKPWLEAHERLSDSIHGYDRPYALRYRGCRLVYAVDHDQVVLIAISVGYGHNAY